MELDSFRGHIDGIFSEDAVAVPSSYSFLQDTLVIKRATREGFDYLLLYPVKYRPCLAWIEGIIDPIETRDSIQIPLSKRMADFLGVSDSSPVFIQRGQFNNVEFWNPSRRAEYDKKNGLTDEDMKKCGI